MKGLSVIMGLVAAGIVATSCTPKTNSQTDGEPMTHLLLATGWFQQSAEMRACYYQSYTLAKMALKENLQNYKGTKPTAVVLDIDETVLDNSPFEAKLMGDRQNYSDSAWMAWSAREEALALPGAAEFIAYARELGVEVFFISNRILEERDRTLRNLASAGMAVDSAHLLLYDLSKKTSCKDERRSLVSESHEILLFIGDNLGDYTSLFDRRDSRLALHLADSLRDDFGRKFIILPNPMYGEWENAIYDHNYKLPMAEKNRMMLDLLRK
ncbi:MAG: 5'-nucleotidase, lipoprotein e(P4) family [Salinivirgaceae bacterium]|nr:5'-nucleotidase, lipoprotein e(P4) family [Salinivirgaceae bacterium]